MMGAAARRSAWHRTKGGRKGMWAGTKRDLGPDKGWPRAMEGAHAERGLREDYLVHIDF